MPLCDDADIRHQRCLSLSAAMAPPQAKDEVRHSASPDIESLVYNDEHEVRATKQRWFIPCNHGGHSLTARRKKHPRIDSTPSLLGRSSSTTSWNHANQWKYAVWCMENRRGSVLCLLVRLAWARGQVQSDLLLYTKRMCCFSLQPTNGEELTVCQLSLSHTHTHHVLVNDPSAGSLFGAASSTVRSLQGPGFVSQAPTACKPSILRGRRVSCCILRITVVRNTHPRVPRFAHARRPHMMAKALRDIHPCG